MMSSGQRRLPELDDRLADMHQIERNHQSMGNGFFFFLIAVMVYHWRIYCVSSQKLPESK